MKKWLTQEGLADLDAVSLFDEKLEKVSIRVLYYAVS
jgi:hypothetical protein